VTRPTKEEEELLSKKSKKKEDESEVDNYFEIQTKCDSDAVIKINETRLDLA
jgi:acetyl-CoA carboxylase carboxyltransferase component